MKKITKIAATFAATMAVLFGAASCSHDGGASLAALSLTDDDDDDDDKDLPVTVNAVWTFAGVTYGEGIMNGLPSTKLTSDVKLTATSGEGATLTAISSSAFKEDSGSGNRGLKTDATTGNNKFSKIEDVKFSVSGIGSSSSDSPIKGVLKLELSGDATVVLKGKATSSNDVRYLLLADDDEEIIALVPKTAGTATDQTIEEELKKGTYYIGLDGFILYSVECK